MLGMRRLLGAGFLTAGCTVVMAVSPASAPAFPAGGGSEVSTGTAPAGGALVTHTDPIPADATQGSVALAPIPGTDPTAFDDITGAMVEDFPWLQKVSKRNQARLACVLISYLPIANKPLDQPITFDDVSLQVALLNVCLRMAQSIPVPPAAADHAGTASAACGRVDAAVTVRVTRAKSRYVVTVISKIGRASRARLTVSCARKGRGLRLGVRPRTRGQTLREAGGPGLGIAYSNPSKKAVGIRTTFSAN